MIGITGTAAKIGNYNTVGDVQDTIADACAEANLRRYSIVDKLCKELGPNSLAVSLDETITLYDGAPEGALDGAGPTFSMREILAAEDPEVAFDEIQARNQKQTERKLAIDYGWCSSNIGFVLEWEDDSSDYCKHDQECDSLIGCGTALSECCIVHDMCLQATSRGPTFYCPAVNCKGATCDANLASCAWGVSCCGWNGWIWGCDRVCLVATTGVSGAMRHGKPNSGNNVDGADSDKVCSE